MTKITDLGDAATPLADTDLVEVVQQVGSSPVNKKVPVSELGGGGIGGYDFGEYSSGLWYPPSAGAWYTPPGFTRSVSAVAGDTLEYACGFMWVSSTSTGKGRIVVVDSAGAVIRTIHSATSLGALYSDQSSVDYDPVSPVLGMTVQAGDVDGGLVRVTVQVNVSGTSKGVYSDGSYGATSRLVNFG